MRTQVCGSAGDTTTLRSVEPPYSYSSKESRRAARKRASIFTELIEEERLEISNASPWPGGWQSRISAKSHKVRPSLHELQMRLVPADIYCCWCQSQLHARRASLLLASVSGRELRTRP